MAVLTAEEEFEAVKFEPFGLPRPNGRPLSTNEVDAALLDPGIFVDQHCWIRGPGGRKMEFRLWHGFQVDVLYAMDEEDRLLVLKARQLGISWLGDAYALWLCTANRGQTVLILSKGLREAQEEMRRIRYMHRNLPEELRRRVGTEVPGERAPDTTQRIEFPEMDSRIISLPSTEDAGTSFTATLAIVHELAKIPNAGPLMAALVPTISDGGGRLFVVSTAKGYVGAFADLWRGDEEAGTRGAGERWRTGQIVGDSGDPGEFRPVFVPWHARPGRDAAWYESTSKGLSGRAMRQEYPESPQQAFQASGDVVFAEEFDRHGPYVLDAARERSNTFDVIGGIDPGVQHAFGYRIEVQGRTLFVYGETHLQNASVEEMGHALGAAIAADGLQASEVVVYVDPFDVGRNLQTLETDLDVLAETGLLVDREGKRYTPAQRVERIKVLLKAGRLWISTDCPRLLDALERAEWATKRGPSGELIRQDTYAKDGKYEHPLDAVGNAICCIFPPFSAAAVETTPAAVVLGHASAGGSEFG